MRTTRWITIIALSVVLTAGCGVQLPRIRRPGHIYQQQLRATYHDPYASPSGAPEFKGARPDSYERPRPLPVQSQWFTTD